MKDIKFNFIKKVIKQALLISIPYSFLVSLILYTVRIESVEVFDATTKQTQAYYGFDAVKYLIETKGPLGYLSGMWPVYVFFGRGFFLLYSFKVQ